MYYVDSRRKEIANKQYKEGMLNWICYCMCRNCLLEHFIEGKIEGTKKKKEEEDVNSHWMTESKREDTIDCKGSTRSHSMEKRLWKRLRSCSMT